jgi:hypothetical protein
VNALLLLQREPDSWVQLVILALFFGFPLVARLIRALLARAGVVQPEAEEETSEQRNDRRRRLREERRRAEVEGEDLWRRLARGEDVTLPRQELPPPEPVVRTGERDVPAEVSLELEAPSAPLSVLGAVYEPSEAPEASLETAGAPAPLLALGGPLSDVTSVAPAAARRAFALAPGDLRRGILLAEILGPPVSDRPLRV